MLSIRQAILVEGRYDAGKIKGIFDTEVFETNGFSIFKDPLKMALLRKVARTKGLIVLTDSDSAGFLIRNHIKGAIQEGEVLHAFIPDIEGKERRKSRPSKEGMLGVEGMEEEVIRKAVLDCCSLSTQSKRRLTNMDLYHLGLSGQQDSAKKREWLKAKLDLPRYLSSNALLDALNATMHTADELKALLADLV